MGLSGKTVVIYNTAMYSPDNDIIQSVPSSYYQACGITHNKGSTYCTCYIESACCLIACINCNRNRSTPICISIGDGKQSRSRCKCTSDNIKDNGSTNVG